MYANEIFNLALFFFLLVYLYLLIQDKFIEFHHCVNTCPCLVECYWSDSVLFLCLITISMYLALIQCNIFNVFEQI